MKTAPQDLLVWALLDPARTLALEPRGWNDVLLLGRRHGVLARLGERLREHGLLERIPYKARGHIRAVCIAAESSQTAIRWEVTKVLRALADVDSPIILLKGAAYVMAGLPAARGRSVGDLDLMVPRNKIEEVERALIEKGWKPSEMEEYDQRFYRDWMHEIPPMQHPERETVLDIHHTIVPLTSRFHPDAAALLAASVPLDNPRLRVLGPADMVLHSTVHVFNDEVGNPFRDLVDLHELLCHFGGQPGFWDDLIVRAKLHGLDPPALLHVSPHPACARHARTGGDRTRGGGGRSGVVPEHLDGLVVHASVRARATGQAAARRRTRAVALLSCAPIGCACPRSCLRAIFRSRPRGEYGNEPSASRRRKGTSDAEEALDAQMLLNPAKEQFDLPATLVMGADGQCRQGKVVGQEDECLGGLGILDANPAQPPGVALMRAVFGRIAWCASTTVPRFTCRIGGISCIHVRL